MLCKCVLSFSFGYLNILPHLTCIFWNVYFWKFVGTGSSKITQAVFPVQNNKRGKVVWKHSITRCPTGCGCLTHLAIGQPLELLPSRPVYATFSIRMASPFSPYLCMTEKHIRGYFIMNQASKHCIFAKLDSLTPRLAYTLKTLDSVVYRIQPMKNFHNQVSHKIYNSNPKYELSPSTWSRQSTSASAMRSAGISFFQRAKRSENCGGTTRGCFTMTTCLLVKSCKLACK